LWLFGFVGHDDTVKEENEQKVQGRQSLGFGNS